VDKAVWKTKEPIPSETGSQNLPLYYIQVKPTLEEAVSWKDFYHLLQDDIDTYRFPTSFP